MRLSLRFSALAVVALLVAGLVGGAPVETGTTVVDDISVRVGDAPGGPYDYTAFRQSPPRSILILQPINETGIWGGAAGYLATVSQLVAERGYYVFPVLVVAQLLKESGIPTAAPMDQASLDKLREITGADAVLFATVHEYGIRPTSSPSAASVHAIIGCGSRASVANIVIDCDPIVVRVSARLVDTRTGTLLWEGSGETQRSSAISLTDSIVEKIEIALFNWIFHTKSEPDPEPPPPTADRGDSRLANMHMFTTANRELPFGPYHTESAKSP